MAEANHNTPTAPREPRSLTAVAQEINRLHVLADGHADMAIAYAKQAGSLLLEVKKTLGHGDWLPWLKKNIEVSPRQAQRYMAAALGKPLPIKAIKNDTVSHLGWLPGTGDMALAMLAGEIEDEQATFLIVQEVEHAPGYFHAVFVDGLSVNWLRRGIRRDHLAGVIEDWLPGRYTRGRSIDDLGWESKPGNAAGLVESLNGVAA